MSGTREQRIAWIAILVCAVVPRLLLAVYNTEANDPHDAVIRLILETGRLPIVDDCWACYQPKLFHQVAAAAIRVLEIEDSLQQIKLAQLLSFTASLGTLAVFWRMAQRLPGPPAARLAAFAVVALNPRFNGISAQATNDSFVVLFGAITVYAFWRSWKSLHWRYTAVAIAGVIAMSLSKTQGTVFFAMLVALLGAKLVFSAPPARQRVALALLALVISYGVSVPFLGPYYEHYRQTGDAFAANWERMPAPHWIEKSLYRRPGVRSIADGYLTFRMIDMLRQPWIGHSWCRGGDRRRYAKELLPTGIGDPLSPMGGHDQQYDPRCAEHRTSLWSQLYGRTQSLRFASNPGSWRIQNPNLVHLGRALLLAGLLPLGVLLLGIGLELRDLVEGLVREGPQWLVRDDRWVLLAIFGGSVFIVAYLAYLMRDFSSMKPIYIFPALACVMALYLRGLSALVRCLDRRPGWLRGLHAAHCVLFLLYVVDIGWLVADLR